MTDKKLTDEEIIKALECHFNEELDKEPFRCVDCPLYNDIRKFKAEIERLKAKVETRTQEKLALGRVYTQKLKTAKTEAYQEFAKFLIDKSSKGLLRTSRLPDYVKEMVGEEE